MNVLEIALQVTLKLNKPELLAVTKTFVKHNYEMVYDDYNWRDVEFTVISNVTAGVQLIPLHPNASRVASVMLMSPITKQLDPVNAVLLTQIDTGAFLATGEPEYYEEYYSTVSIVPAGPDVPGTPGTHNIKLYPTPAVDTSILIVAIRTITPMSADSSTPAIRNIDNVLIALTEADLLERIKQYGMAEGKRKEAMALLEKAKELDQQSRTNIPRQIKQTTVTGDTMGELIDACSMVTGHWAPEDRVMMRERYRRNYVTIYDSALWRESQFVKVFTSQYTGIIIMPKDVGLVMAVARNEMGSSLGYTDLSRYFEFDPMMLDNIGEPVSFTTITPMGVDRDMSTTEKVQWVSTSPDDKSEVFIRGQRAGLVQEEYGNFNGTTAVDSKNNYDRILTFGKKTTVGSGILKGKDSTNILVTLEPFENSRQNQAILINPTYDGTASSSSVADGISVRVLGKRALNPFVKDEDRPIISGIGNILINMTAADIARKYGDAANVEAFGKKAASELGAKVSKEREQSANATIIVPYTEPSAIDWE